MVINKNIYIAKLVRRNTLSKIEINKTNTTLLQQLQQQQQQPPKKNTAKILANEIAELNQKGIYIFIYVYLNRIKQTNIIFVLFYLYMCVCVYLFVIYIKILYYIDMWIKKYNLFFIFFFNLSLIYDKYE